MHRAGIPFTLRPPSDSQLFRTFVVYIDRIKSETAACSWRLTGPIIKKWKFLERKFNNLSTQHLLRVIQ